MTSVLHRYLAIAVGVEDVNDALHQRILLKLGKRHELVDGQGSRVVQVQLSEPLAEAPNLVSIDCHIRRRILCTKYFSRVIPPFGLLPKV